MRRRYPSRNSKYYVDRDLYTFAVDYARMMPVWSRELAWETDHDRILELRSRIDIIDKAAEKAAPDEVLKDYLLQSVTCGITFDKLKSRGMPCGKDLYSQIRQAFYYHLAGEIK